MLTEWQQIENSLGNLQGVEGGFSPAKRGLVVLPDGQSVFVKCGITDDTQRWAKKEIQTYHFLEEHVYPHSSRLIAVSPDETSFAIEAHLAKDGWVWRNLWSHERLHGTLQAMDDLAAIPLTTQEQELFNERSVGPDDDGWLRLLKSGVKQARLLKKLEQADAADIAKRLHFERAAIVSNQYAFAADTLVHQDVRGDNCAWNPQLNEVRLVDWNWLQYGDRDIDMAATLAHVAQTGCDISGEVLTRLKPDALHWVAGYWCHAAITPIWENGPVHLREMQLHAGIAALRLMERL